VILVLMILSCGMAFCRIVILMVGCCCFVVATPVANEDLLLSCDLLYHFILSVGCCGSCCRWGCVFFEVLKALTSEVG
jgi:hypothetical protein